MIIKEIADKVIELKAWRHQIHAHPETAFEEVKTSAFVAQKLEEWGIEVHRGIGITGVVGVIKGKSEGPTIGLRADMDALPLTEETGLEYTSQIKNKFHGCGHDGHTVMLLGAAQYLAKNPPLHGNVHLIFQPAEENLRGAAKMVEDGLFERFPCDQVYGLHTIPLYKPGTAAIRTGAALSSIAMYEIAIEGVGSHGAAPHTAVDPLQAAARIAMDISSIVGRYIDPFAPAVISLGRMVAGAIDNIIPASASLAGTVRSFDVAVQNKILDHLQALCDGVETSTGCKVTLTIKTQGLPCINSEQGAKTAVKAAGKVLGAENIMTDTQPLPFSDDFAQMLAQWGGAYIFLGQDGPMCHNPGFDFDDKLLPIGASIFCNIVMDQTSTPA